MRLILNNIKRLFTIVILSTYQVTGYSQVPVSGGDIDLYTKTQLQTSGQSSINFNNIFGVPDSLELASQASEATSRTIYVAATGNDVTGTGAVGFPYLTIGKALSTINKRISSGVTITVSVGVGTFSISSADLSVLSSVAGSGALTIQGTLVLVESGFTMGSPEALDPYTYAVSGGNTGTWTANQWKFYFLKSGSSYYPVTHNTTTTLSIAGNVTGTEIYQAQTIVNFPENTSVYLNIALNFTQVALNAHANVASFTFFSPGTLFTECYFTALRSGTTVLGIKNLDALRHTRTSFNNFRINQGISMQNCFLYVNTNSALLGLNGGDSFTSLTCVLENPNTGASAAGAIFNTDHSILRTITTATLKFVNTPHCISYTMNSISGVLSSKSSITLKNCSYLLRKASTATDYQNIVIDVTSFIGTPTTRWFYDPMYEFVNLATGRNIQVSGVVYPEYVQSSSVTITNNAVTNIQIGDSLQNTSIDIDYTAIRGDSVEYGTLTLVNKMAKGLEMSESASVGSDAGLTFSVSFITPKKINLAIAATNTVAGTFKYSAVRRMRTPITL